MQIARASSRFVLAALVVFATACDDGSVTDAGATDAGATDAGASMDAAAADAGGTLVYPPCRFDPMPMCDAPFDLCEVYGGGSAPHHCTYHCTTASDCPAPETGTATVICSGATDDVCQLDCTSGTCPDGMVCITMGPMSSTHRCAFNP